MTMSHGLLSSTSLHLSGTRRGDRHPLLAPLSTACPIRTPSPLTRQTHYGTAAIDEPIDRQDPEGVHQVKGGAQRKFYGLRSSHCFWSLVERPPMAIPKMLQIANQYVVAEVLVAGKREDKKRPRAESSRGSPATLKKKNGVA
ncbi:hypothetical protein B296_00002524 [Ensete ventricosum]|uniref:Uncharacterized protein n=1 Tax=Ensete ventricosum TaxID=4639 RepID=A0A427AU83_ENSVE|nr:hypothetical protein B296_00002524 [Ensete ventricosum]